MALYTIRSERQLVEQIDYRCQPWRAKRRLVDPSSREVALFSRRALRQRENKVGLRTRRPVIGSQVRSSNELANKRVFGLVKDFGDWDVPKSITRPKTRLAFLDEKTTQIDQLIEKTQQSINLLKEKRAALITAAVTGKIDVRDWNEEAA